MKELANNATFQKNCSSTEVAMANEQMNYCPTATAANTPRENQEQASTAATATAASQSDTTVQDRQEKLKLLAALSIPILTAPAPDSRFDIGRATRGNLLRQLTEYMDSVGESPTYESMNSCQVHNLIDFKQKKNANVEVKHGMKKLMSLSESQTQNVVDQL
eukprot:scaffold41052_cov422-Skeletonema_dohrnii-CCMP3373.AAC.1